MQYDENALSRGSPFSKNEGSDQPDASQAKQFIEFNLQLEYTSDEEVPVKVVMDIPVDEKALAHQADINNEELNSESLSRNSTEETNKEYSIYEEGVIFVEPMFILDPRHFTCMSLKLQLRRMLWCVPDQTRLMLSLLNRSRNKPVFLRHLRDLLVDSKLSLIDVSKLFMRINSVYKQASIERQQIKKKASTATNRLILDSMLMNGHSTELMLL